MVTSQNDVSKSNPIICVEQVLQRYCAANTNGAEFVVKHAPKSATIPATWQDFTVFFRKEGTDSALRTDVQRVNDRQFAILHHGGSTAGYTNQPSQLISHGTDQNGKTVLSDQYGSPVTALSLAEGIFSRVSGA